MLGERVGQAGPAIVTHHETWSGDELLRRAAGASAWLDGIGAPRGRPVAALVDTSPPAFALLVGGAASSRPLAPLGTGHTAPELAACLGTLGVETLLAEPEHEALAAEVASRCGVRVVSVPAVEAQADFGGLESIESLELDAGPDAIVVVLHTSGTTGAPKAVPVRNDRMASRTRIYAEILDLDSRGMLATASPFHHLAGVGMAMVALGAGASTAAWGHFSVDRWHHLAALAPTHVVLVPTMIEMLLDDESLGIPTLELLQYGAAPIHPDTVARILRTLPNVGLAQVYGLTEGSPLTCLTPDDHRRALDGHPELLASVGRAVPGAELTIDGADERGIGEVRARADHIFVTGPGGWLHTGDLGRLDAEGYLHLVGREDDMIIRGGENVHPQEVERVLATHPDVREVSVVGVSDRRLGETVRAFVVPADPATPPSPYDLHVFARDQLAGYKVPSHWVFVDELPHSPTGKMLRRRLASPDDEVEGRERT